MIEKYYAAKKEYRKEVDEVAKKVEKQLEALYRKWLAGKITLEKWADEMNKIDPPTKEVPKCEK